MDVGKGRPSVTWRTGFSEILKATLGRKPSPGFPMEMESVLSASSLLSHFCFNLFYFDAEGKCHSSFTFILNV